MKNSLYLCMLAIIVIRPGTCYAGWRAEIGTGLKYIGYGAIGAGLYSYAIAEIEHKKSRPYPMDCPGNDEPCRDQRYHDDKVLAGELGLAGFLIFYAGSVLGRSDGKSAENVPAPSPETQIELGFSPSRHGPALVFTHAL